MSATKTDLTSLTRTRADAAVPMPGRKWRTRVLLPMVVLLAAGGVLAYAARASLIAAVPVHVVPVIQKESQPGETDAAHTQAMDQAPARRVLVQAPGWIEPDPYAFTVPALAEGVIREVLIVEGQRVEAGEVLARMIDEDAALALRRAQAEVEEREADVIRATADHAAAIARTDELRDDLNRKKPLVESGAIGAAELTQLELRVRAAERGIAAADGMLAQSRAAERRARVMLDEAALMLARMEIRSPISGIVMQRMVEPGVRISMGSGNAEGMTAAVARLYDPSKIQSRVDVPISDAAKVAVGDDAEVMTEALPDMVFKGIVSRAVHEANIQRNTVQFKIAITDPSPVLKPEMLTRVRLLGSPTAATGPAPSEHAQSPSMSPGVTLLLPEEAILDRAGETGHVWLVDQRDPVQRAVARKTEVGLAPDAEGYVRITRGLRPGDRVIVDAPATLTEGARVRILGEKEEE